MKVVIPRRGALGYLSSKRSPAFNSFDIFQHEYSLWFLRSTRTRSRSVTSGGKAAGCRTSMLKCVPTQNRDHYVCTRRTLHIWKARANTAFNYRPLLSVWFKWQHNSIFTLRLMWPFLLCQQHLLSSLLCRICKRSGKLILKMGLSWNVRGAAGIELRRDFQLLSSEISRPIDSRAAVWRKTSPWGLIKKGGMTYSFHAASSYGLISLNAMAWNNTKTSTGARKSNVNNVRARKKTCTAAGKLLGREKRRGGCIELDEGELG